MRSTTSSSMRRYQNRITRPYDVGQSPLEVLPPEILQKVLANLELHPGSIYGLETSNLDHTILEKPTLFSCLLTSRVLYTNALPITYRSVTISHMSAFNRILRQVTYNPKLGRAIRHLDLSDLKTTRSKRDFSNSLYGMICLTPLLREIHLPHDTNLNESLSESLLRILFLKLPHLRILDLNNCTSPALESSKIFSQTPDTTALPIKSLSLDNCQWRNTPPASTSLLTSLLPRLVCIQSITLSKSNITTQTLQLLPANTRITHLVLDHCPHLDTSSLVDFLISHSSVKNTLEFLSAITNPSETESNEEEASKEQITQRLLKHLPKSLHTLRLGGWKMGPSCVAPLRNMIRTAEHLKVGPGLLLHDLESLFLDPETNISISPSRSSPNFTDTKPTTTLLPLTRAISLCKIRHLHSTTPLPTHQNSSIPTLQSLDIRDLDVEEQDKIRCSILLGRHSGALKRIVVGEKMMDGERGEELRGICAGVGWKGRREGRRGVLVRL